MEFEWDADKSEMCFQQRGFDFAYATQAFFDPKRAITLDTRYDYGEARYQLHGHIEHRLYVVAYTVRGEVVRIISARKANLREVKHHENSTRED
jgi:uncharacterized protein